jgi:hypothetical protein
LYAHVGPSGSDLCIITEGKIDGFGERERQSAIEQLWARHWTDIAR